MYVYHVFFNEIEIYIIVMCCSLSISRELPDFPKKFFQLSRIYL